MVLVLNFELQNYYNYAAIAKIVLFPPFPGALLNYVTPGMLQPFRTLTFVD